MGPAALREVLKSLPVSQDPRLLVSGATFDDAGVYKLREDLALVQTVDFFTPIVDDPYTFGEIAAANAFSDIYAMGAVPLTALNITCFPVQGMDLDILSQILAGGAAKVKEAGALLVGGHTVEDPEPKYGLAVTGVVHPARILTNAGACPGDVLVLTKPLGTGVIATAVKAELASPEVQAAAILTMRTLNREASQVAVAVGVHAVTDITGFGFLGHAAEMAEAGQVSLEVQAGQFPFLPGAEELANMGLVPAGAYRNREYLGDKISFDSEVPDAHRDLLFDPQTSGGLLIAVAPEKMEELEAGLKAKGTVAAVVGRVEAGAPRIAVHK